MTGIAIPSFEYLEAPEKCKAFARNAADGLADNTIDYAHDDSTAGAIGTVIGAHMREASVRKSFYKKCIAAAKEPGVDTW